MVADLHSRTLTPLLCNQRYGQWQSNNTTSVALGQEQHVQRIFTDTVIISRHERWTGVPESVREVLVERRHNRDSSRYPDVNLSHLNAVVGSLTHGASSVTSHSGRVWDDVCKDVNR